MKAKLAADSNHLMKGVESALLHFDVILSTWSDYQEKHGKPVKSEKIKHLDPETMEKLADALYRLRNLIDDAYQLREDLLYLVKA